MYVPFKLSQNFSLEEMLRSDAAVRLGFDEQFTPSQQIINNLTALCVNVLEPLRKAVGKPIHILSGYRCPRLNAAIGGAVGSQHMALKNDEAAADTFVDGMTIQEWYNFIKASKAPYSQLIQEFNQWAHTSYDSTARRNNNLIATKENGVTVYTPDAT